MMTVHGLSVLHTSLKYGDHTLRLRYVEMGVGRPILFLHGWGQNADAFFPLMESLSGQGRLLALDCPGFGESGLPPDAWDTVTYSECVLRWMDHLSLDRCIVVGHSFGGRLAVRMAQRWPKRIESIVLISSAGLRRTVSPFRKFRIRLIQTLAKTMGTIIPGSAGDRMKRRIYKTIASADYLHAGMLRETFVKVVNEDLTPLLPEITQPALLIWGDQDTQTPPELGKRMDALLPNSTYVEIPGFDHYTILGRGRHQVSHHIESFTAKHAGDEHQS